MTSYKINQSVVDQVTLDGLPRLVNDEIDPAVQHVLYLEGDRVRSMLSGEWPPPLPTDPTPAQSAAAIAARIAAKESERTAFATIRQQVLTAYRPVVGQAASIPLTAAQQQAERLLILWVLGGITKDGTRADPVEWAKR